MDGLMARATHNKGLASAHGHELHPRWFLSSPRLSEIGELADVVDLNWSCTPAEFTRAYQEPFHQLVLSSGEHIRRTIYHRCHLLPDYVNGAQFRDQWLLPFAARDHHLETGSRSSAGCGCRFVLPRHFLNTRTVFPCEGL